MNEKVKVDRATAERDFQRLCESWHIESDGTDEVGTIESIIKALEKGVLVVREQGEKGSGMKLVLVHNLSEGIQSGQLPTLTYKFITVGSMICMDQFKPHEAFKRMVAIVAAISGVGEPSIRQMVGKDLMLAQGVGGLFLGV